MAQIPTRADCQKENCDSIEQQDYRVLQHWLAEPHGRFDARISNFYRVCIALEHAFGRLLRKSNETAFHEYWCDGVAIIDHTATPERFHFAGACTLSDNEANSMWLAPFDFTVEYRDTREWPTAASVRIGHVDASEIFNRSLPVGREHRLSALAHWIHGERPSDLSEWAMSVELAPYPPPA